ncbi:MAG: hypothetical protein BAJATHORv1_40064 [Candidatus Thorarchaeota archaeon]|nr:MAG: hypothetical protein BAJATHORv1_40064 [Candidatus Thorarchaeota archaeon]
MARKTKSKTVQSTLGDLVETESKTDSKKGKKTMSRKKATKSEKTTSKLDMKKLPGVGAKTRDSLIESGYSTVEKIAKSKPATISKKVDGIGESTAEKIVTAAKDMIKASKPDKKTKRKKPSKSKKTTSKFDMKKLPGVGEKTRDSLIESGYSTVEKIAKTKPATISKKVDGIGESTAEKIVTAAKDMIKASKSTKKTTKSKKSTKSKPSSKVDISLDELPGIGSSTKEKLIEAGYDSIDKIASAETSTLAKKVEGVGKKTATDAIAEAKKLMKTDKPQPSRKKKTKPKESASKPSPDKKLLLKDLPGIGKKTAEKMEESGYDSVVRVARATPESIAKRVSGISTSMAQDIVEVAKELVKKQQMDEMAQSTSTETVPEDKAEMETEEESKKEKKTPKSRKSKKTKKEKTKEPESDKSKVTPKKTSKKRTRKKRTHKTPQQILEEKRSKIVKKKSGLPVPKTIVALTKEMKDKWAVAEAREAAFQAGELSDEEMAGIEETIEVLDLTRNETKQKVVEVAREILQETMVTGRPAFEIPKRSSSNIVWDEIRDLLLLGMDTVSRPYHSLGSVVDATRTARVMEIVFQLLESNLHATKREVFYSDVNLFRDQKYSDRILEDVASMLHTTRDSIHVVASARGSAMGRVVIRDGGDLIDLTKMGTGGWAITPFLDQVEIVESDAEYILLSEKDAAVMRLAEAKYWNREPCIVLTGKGSGDIATRAFLKKLVKELEIPAFALVDSDPYGHYIYSVFLRGSKRLSYESPFIATPELKLLGVLSRDLDEYSIPKAVRIPMEATDIKRVKDMIDEPFVKSNKEWVKDLKLMLKIKEKAEIQAFASHSFSYLTDEYIPTKLETGDWI